MALIPYLYKRLRAYGVPHDQAIIIADPDLEEDYTGIHTAVDEYIETLNLEAGAGNLPSGGTTSHYLRGDTTWQTLNKTAVGLANVDNTADTAKPVSTAQQTALDLKANLASPTFTGTVGGITKAMVGLTNVDNTSDADKPISSAVSDELDLKAPLASPTFTGTVSGVSKSMVGLGNVDNTSDTNKPVSTATQTALDAKAPLASPTFTGTVSGITKSMVGLGNVDNTSDANKPVSTATQTALDLKANLAGPTFTGTTTVATLSVGTTATGITKSMVGLGNVANVDQTNGDNITSGTVAIARLDTEKVITWATGSEPSLSGVPDGTLWVEYTP